MNSLVKGLMDIVSKEVVVMFTAALPIIELRGAIPIGISLGLSPLHSAIISLLGSIIPVPFIIFTIRPIFNYMKKTKLFRGLVVKLTNKSMGKSRNIKKYGAWGLFIFVAIPLPGTGVWSGSLIAALLNMRFRWAFPAIFLGNLIAGIIIMLLSHGVITVFT